MLQSALQNYDQLYQSPVQHHVRNPDQGRRASKIRHQQHIQPIDKLTLTA